MVEREGAAPVVACKSKAHDCPCSGESFFFLFFLPSSFIEIQITPFFSVCFYLFLTNSIIHFFSMQLLKERDGALRAAALAVIEEVWAEEGADTVWKLLGQLDTREKGMVEDRLRRSTKQSKDKINADI